MLALQVETWDELLELAHLKIKVLDLDEDYLTRLNFEIEEINKQGARDYWIRLFNSRKKFDHNKNGLVLPFLLNLTKIDPIKHEWSYQYDPKGKFLTDIVIITIGDQEYLIPGSCMVKTKRGMLRASELDVGDEFV